MIFIDTEFSSLSDPRLISIGAVTENGHHFYAVTDDVPVSACSPFVRERVLPLLDAHPAPVRGSHDAVARAFSAWLDESGGDAGGCVLFVDDECDRELLQRLLHAARYRGGTTVAACRLLPIAGDAALSRAFDDWFSAAPGRCRHNALDDALAYRHALLSTGFIRA